MITLGAVTMGEISRDEFKLGFYDWSATDMKTIKSKCQGLKKQLATDNDMFLCFYNWCFHYFKDPDSPCRTIPIETAIEAWGILLRDWYIYIHILHIHE